MGIWGSGWYGYESRLATRELKWDCLLSTVHVQFLENTSGASSRTLWCSRAALNKSTRNSAWNIQLKSWVVRGCNNLCSFKVWGLTKFCISRNGKGEKQHVIHRVGWDVHLDPQHATIHILISLLYFSSHKILLSLKLCMDIDRCILLH